MVVEMRLKAIVHEAEEGGYWAEVPAIPGCATRGETMEALMADLREAVHACLAVDVEQPDESHAGDRAIEIAV